MDEKQKGGNTWTIGFIVFVMILIILICLLLVGFQTDWFTHFPPATNITISGKG